MKPVTRSRHGRQGEPRIRQAIPRHGRAFQQRRGEADWVLSSITRLTHFTRQVIFLSIKHLSWRGYQIYVQADRFKPQP
jgi:hypothetical protein